MSKKATIIAVVNQKGGTGKTTTTENLGVGLALEGKKVLLVDTDPQASLTVSLGNPCPDDLSPTLSDLMGKIMMENPITPDEGILHHPEGVDLVPSNIELSGMEVALVNAMSRETILRQYLDTVKQNYDYILLDCMPSLGMIIDHNNLANFETWIFFKWVFKTFVAVMLITNTFNITMAVFDVTQHVINASAGIISGNTAIDASALETMEETLMAMDLGPLLGLFLQSFIVQVTMSALAIIIFVIVYGRMIEIYLMVSLAPIPLSTFGNREQSNIGQNYLRSLFAIGFQGFLIMICVGIYAVLIQSIAFSDDIIGSIWGVMGYTVLLCFTLFKTGSLAKGVFSAH